MAKIYALVDPRDNNIKYVGKTSLRLSKRLSSHYKEKKTPCKKAWIEELIVHGLKPTIELLEECSENRWQEREIHWISVCSKIYGLTNILPGGKGLPLGYKHSAEAVEKIRQASIHQTAGRFTADRRGNRAKAIENCKKKVGKYDLLGNLVAVYKGSKDAANSVGVTTSCIGACIAGRVKRIAGFQWIRITSNPPYKIAAYVAKDNGSA